MFEGLERDKAEMNVLLDYPVVERGRACSNCAFHTAKGRGCPIDDCQGLLGW